MHNNPRDPIRQSAGSFPFRQTSGLQLPGDVDARRVPRKGGGIIVGGFGLPRHPFQWEPPLEQLVGEQQPERERAKDLLRQSLPRLPLIVYFVHVVNRLSCKYSSALVDRLHIWI